MFFESTLMGSALGCMLSVNEGIIFFSVLIGMREGYFDVGSLEMNNRIKHRNRQIVVQQIFQSIATYYVTSIIVNAESGIEIGIIAQLLLNIFITEGIVEKKCIIRYEKYFCSILLFRIGCLVVNERTFSEDDTAHLSITV